VQKKSKNQKKGQEQDVEEDTTTGGQQMGENKQFKRKSI